MDKNTDRTSITIYGINSKEQTRINQILKCLEIEPRKRQNINLIDISVKVKYFGGK